MHRPCVRALGLWSGALCNYARVGLRVCRSWAYVSVNLWLCGFGDLLVRRSVGLWILISRKVWAESLPLMAASLRKEENMPDFLFSL